MKTSRITKSWEFCAAHRLYRYNGKCSSIHGHTYKVVASVIGNVNKGEGDNMLLDFGNLSKEIKTCRIEVEDLRIKNKKLRDLLIKHIQTEQAGIMQKRIAEIDALLEGRKDG